MTEPLWKQAPIVEPAWKSAPLADEVRPEIPRGTFGVPLPNDIDTTPLPTPEPVKTRGGVVRRTSPTVEKAAKAGVDYSTGAKRPVSKFIKGGLQELDVGRTGLSFSVNPTSQHSTEWLSRELTNEFYGDQPRFMRKTVHVRVGPESNEIEYLNPKTKRWTFLNPVGLDAGDVESASGDVVAMIPDIAGAFLASRGKGKGTGTKAVLGGASGAVLGEIIRIELGRSRGLNKEVSTEEEVKQALQAGLISAAAGGATLAGLEIVKAARNFLKGNIFTKEQAARWEQNITDAKQIEDLINFHKIPPGTGAGRPEFRLNLAQQTRDPELLAAEHAFAGTPGPRQTELAAQQKTRQEAARGYLQEVSPSANRPAYEAGADIQQSIRPQIESELSQSAGTVQQTRQAAQQSVGQIPVGSQTMPGSFAANILIAEREAFKKWGQQEAAKVNTAAANIPIPNATLSATAEKFDKELQSSIIKSIEAHKKSVVGSRTVEVDPQIRVLRESLGLDADELAPIFNPNTKWTFQQAWDTVSSLKDLERRAAKEFTTGGPDAATYKRLRIALEKDIDEGLAGTPAAKLYDEFKAQYRAQRALIESTAKEGMIERPDVFFNLAFVNKNRELSDQFAYLVPEGSGARTAYRDGIFQHYRDFVLAEGELAPKRHAEWMKQWGDFARPYFGKKDWDLLQTANTAEQAFQKAAAADKIVRERIATSFGQNLLDAAPQDVVKRIWGSEKMFELKQFKSIAPADAVDRLKDAVRDEIARKITARGKNGEFLLSYRQLDDYLGTPKGPGHADVIRELFGQQYLDDLDVLRKALRLSQLEAETVNRSGTALLSGEYAELNQKLLMRMVRLWAGPLSHGPYAIRQAFGIGDNLIEEQVYNVIKNPDLLHTLVKERYLSPSSKKAAVILGQIGALSIWSPEPSPTGAR